MFGWFELLVVFGVVLLVFGASRVPDLAQSLGESVNEFKAGLNTKTGDDEPDVFDAEDEE
jgi:sec-independent protein translocase protein TatA